MNHRLRAPTGDGLIERIVDQRLAQRRAQGPADDLAAPGIQNHREERSPVGAIEACGAALAHVHLCDSHGKRVGTGNFDFAPVLAELQRGGYAGVLSVKVYREPWRSVAAASLQFLRELLAAS